MRFTTHLLIVFTLFAVCHRSLHAQSAKRRPNVIVIMTDNHGAWTLGCYGNRDIRTPNIDRLAREGTLFTRAFACNPVCSPTRASFLTGLLPSQHGVHCFLVGGRLQIGPDARSTLADVTSLPEVLKREGYACGLVGKWHLGDNLHPQEGFDDYWITMPHGATSTFYNAQVIENEKLRKEPEYLTSFWTRHALKFISKSAKEPEPFFLFLSYNGPYSLGRLLLRDGRNRHTAHYRDKSLPSFPRTTPHPWQYNNLDYQNNDISIRRVAAEVSGVDDGVGQILDRLKALGIDDDTLVVFLADQGWSGGHGGFFGMGDHTRPVTTTDPMMQIPLIWRHPRRVRAKRRATEMVGTYDLLPSLLSYLQIDDSDVKTRSPGRDFSSVLSGCELPDWKNEVFYEFESLRCIRTERWKYVKRYPNGPNELYDLVNDADESDNLVADPKHTLLKKRLDNRLTEYYRRHAEPKYDLWKGGKSQTRLFVGIDEEAAQLRPIDKPFDKNFKPVELDVPEGFTVDVAAASPLVTHPTLACLDDRGRLFVCNNAGLNLSAAELEKQLPNSIRMLEDLDGDGRFDKSTVFADKMTYPMGGAWHDGALYVASPPNIWRLEDTDGDGKADKRDIIVSKFGYTGNAASIHGCFLGPDGRLYWCDGYHGHEFRDKQGNIQSKREGSYLFSCRPDGSDPRIHCGGGMDNPVEVDFTETGELIGTVNIFYTRPRVDCLVHWLLGGAYPHRERVLKELQVTGPLLGPIHKFGHVAISGTTRYRSGVIERTWTDNFFATFFNSGKVVRLEIEPSGSSYSVVQREFLSSSNRDFHPTDVLEDADGSLLVVDTGGWFYRGCPTSQISKPEVLGAVYRIRRKGMTVQNDPWGVKIPWSQLSVNQLLRYFNDTRHQVRAKAISVAAQRGDKLVSALDRALRTRDIRVRLNSVWALTRIIAKSKSSQAKRSLRFALSDRSPMVRHAACSALVACPDPLAINELGKLAGRGEMGIRRQAAAALGRTGSPQAAPLLLRALDGSSDKELQHAITFALIETKAVEELKKYLQNPNPLVVRSALVALDQLDRNHVSPEHPIFELSSENEALKKEILRVFARHKGRTGWSKRASVTIRKLIERGNKADHEVIESLMTEFLDTPEVTQLVGNALSSPNSPFLSIALRSIAAGKPARLHESWRAPLESALETDRLLALHALAALKTDAFKERLTAISSNNDVPLVERMLALRAIAGGTSQLSDSAFKILLSTLQSTPAQARVAAEWLGSSALTKQQLIALSPHLRTAGPIAINELVRPFLRNSTREVAEQFLKHIEAARSLENVPHTVVSDIVKRYPDQHRTAGNKILDRMRSKEQAKLLRIDKLLSQVKKASAERGRKLFFAEKSKCASCHRIGKEGKRVGPDLTSIGSNRSAADLLESIVVPSATIVRDYEPQNVRTNDGRLYDGIVVRETADTIHLQQASGKVLEISVSDIDVIRSTNVSIMPNGLEKALTEEELADVVKFLTGLK